MSRVVFLSAISIVAYSFQVSGDLITRYYIQMVLTNLKLNDL